MSLFDLVVKGVKTAKEIGGEYYKEYQKCKEEYKDYEETELLKVYRSSIGVKKLALQQILKERGLIL